MAFFRPLAIVVCQYTDVCGGCKVSFWATLIFLATGYQRSVVIFQIQLWDEGTAEQGESFLIIAEDR